MAAQQRRVSARIEAAREPQNDASSQSDFDVSSYLNRIHEMDKNVARSSTEAAALEALDTTKGHHTRQHRLERSFHAHVKGTVTTDGTPKWGEVMKLIPNPNYNTKFSSTMASRAGKIAAVARDIFGTLPNRNVRTGMQFLKKPLTGAYEARYYMEPIEPIARKVSLLISYYLCLL